MKIIVRHVWAIVFAGAFFCQSCGRSDRGDAVSDNGEPPTGRPAEIDTPPGSAADRRAYTPPPGPDTRTADVTLQADGSLEEALSPLFDIFLLHGAISLGDRSLTPLDNPYETIESFSVAIVSVDPAQRERSVLGPVEMDLAANPMNPAQYMFVLDSADPLWSGLKAAGVIDLAQKVVEVSSIRGRFDLTKEFVQAVPRWGPFVWSRFRPAGKIDMGGSVFWDQAELPNSELTFGFTIQDFGFDLLPGLRVEVDDEAQRIDRQLRGLETHGGSGGPHIHVQVQYAWDVDLVDQKRHLRQRLYCGDLRGRLAGGLLRAFISLPLITGHPFHGNMELVDCEGGQVLPRILPPSETLSGKLSGEITYRGLLGNAKSLELADGRVTLSAAELQGSSLYRAMAASGVFDLPERPAPEDSILDVRFTYNEIIVPDEYAVLPEEALNRDFPRNPAVSFSEIRLTVHNRSLIGAGHIQPDGSVHLTFSNMRRNRPDPDGPRLIVAGNIAAPQTRRSSAMVLHEFPEEFLNMIGSG